MFRVLARLDEGEFLFVASRELLDEAVQLIEGLNAYWPRQYVVLDSAGHEMSHPVLSSMERERPAASNHR